MAIAHDIQIEDELDENEPKTNKNEKMKTKPHVHGMQSSLPAAHDPDTADRPVVAQYDPAGHAMHALDPVEARKVPAKHEEQLVAPVVAPYLPTPQLVHGAEPEDEKVPTLHAVELLEQLDAPALEVVPESQLVQLLEPEPAA